jgi:hypothetical protein
MDLDKLHQKLIATARAHVPGSEVPYAFEKRIIARLREHAVMDHWGLWAQALWRAVAPCVAIMLLLGAWSLFTPSSKTSTGDLSQDIENTLLAAVDQDQPFDSTW